MVCWCPRHQHTISELLQYPTSAFISPYTTAITASMFVLLLIPIPLVQGYYGLPAEPLVKPRLIGPQVPPSQLFFCCFLQVEPEFDRSPVPFEMHSTNFFYNKMEGRFMDAFTNMLVWHRRPSIWLHIGVIIAGVCYTVQALIMSVDV